MVAACDMWLPFFVPTRGAIMAVWLKKNAN